MSLITLGAIQAVEREFNKDIQESIDKRCPKNNPQSESQFHEICIYEDSLRIMKRVLNRVYNNPTDY